MVAQGRPRGLCLLPDPWFFRGPHRLWRGRCNEQFGSSSHPFMSLHQFNSEDFELRTYLGSWPDPDPDPNPNLDVVKFEI
jgi:hypothetical protein